MRGSSCLQAEPDMVRKHKNLRRSASLGRLGHFVLHVLFGRLRRLRHVLIFTTWTDFLRQQLVCGETEDGVLCVLFRALCADRYRDHLHAPLAEGSGLSEATIGTSLAAAATIAVVVNPLVGTVADRTHRHKAILIGLIVCATLATLALTAISGAVLVALLFSPIGRSSRRRCRWLNPF